MRARKETKWNAEAWENEAKNPRATAIRMTKEEAERIRESDIETLREVFTRNERAFQMYAKGWARRFHLEADEVLNQIYISLPQMSYKTPGSLVFGLRMYVSGLIMGNGLSLDAEMPGTEDCSLCNLLADFRPVPDIRITERERTEEFFADISAKLEVLTKGNAELKRETLAELFYNYDESRGCLIWA